MKLEETEEQMTEHDIQASLRLLVDLVVDISTSPTSVSPHDGQYGLPDILVIPVGR
jgi:hypothetical protein